MAPIKVALIGLSQSAKTSWASEAHLPYLLSARGRERYQIKALLNSSVKAAQAAIEYYKLPSDTRAYGSPQDLANDPDIDLVVCATRVDIHYDTIKPSIKTGKATYVEWPLAENVSRAGELAELAEHKNGPALVGLQGRIAPATIKVKEIIQSGQLGKVLSSSVQAFTPWSRRDSISEGLTYFLDKKVGGNFVTIAFGHMMDTVHSVLGEYETSNAHVQIQRPSQMVADKETGSRRSQTSDVPDLISVQGTLQTSSAIQKDASLVVNFRRGPPFPGTAPFVWTINCEKAELRISSENGPSLHSGTSEHVFPIEIHDFATDEVKSVEWKWEDWRAALPPRSRNIAKLYDLYAEGKAEAFSCADFGAAVVRHRQLDKMLYEKSPG